MYVPEAVISVMEIKTVTSSEAVALSDKLIKSKPADSTIESGSCLSYKIFTAPTIYA